MRRSTSSFLLATLLLLVALVIPSQGATFYVLYVDGTDGVDNATCISADPSVTATPCKTIGFALSAAGVSDFIDITVYPGTYTGPLNTNFTLNQESFTIHGVVDSSTGALPVIDCQYSTFGATVTPKTTAEIDYLEFRHCTASQGGAINVVTSINMLTISHCAFTSNHATAYGGAIYTQSYSLRLTNSTFSNNTAPYGGALAVWAQLVSVQQCSFHDNNATTGGGAIYGKNIVGGGGGVLPTMITSCNFTNNFAATQGGAFLSESDSTTAVNLYSFAQTTIDNNCITDPYTESYTPQIRCSPASSCNVTDRGVVSGCTNFYTPPTFSNSTGGGGGISSKDRKIIIGVIVPFGVLFIASIALFLFFRKKTDSELEKREQYRKKILKALDNMTPEEQEAARLEAERADPHSPKCQLCRTRPIVNPLPCGHEVVCSVCRTILLACPICKSPTRA